MGRSYATLNSFSFSTTILDNCSLELGFLVYPTLFLSSRRNTLVYILTRDVHRQGTMHYYSLGLHPHLPFTLRLMRGRQVRSKVEDFSFWLSNNTTPLSIKASCLPYAHIPYYPSLTSPPALSHSFSPPPPLLLPPPFLLLSPSLSFYLSPPPPPSVTPSRSKRPLPLSLTPAKKGSAKVTKMSAGPYISARASQLGPFSDALYCCCPAACSKGRPDLVDRCPHPSLPPSSFLPTTPPLTPPPPHLPLPPSCFSPDSSFDVRGACVNYFYSLIYLSKAWACRRAVLVVMKSSDRSPRLLQP